LIAREGHAKCQIMSQAIRNIWGRFPDLGDLAEALKTSEAILRRERDAGRLPPPECDDALLRILRSSGMRLNKERLTALRRGPASKQERQKIIDRFYEKAGGIVEVSQRTGCSTTHLYTNRYRGRLNRSSRHEYLRLAAEIGFALPDAIFNAPE
jgi:hypothetical protein